MIPLASVLIVLIAIWSYKQEIAEIFVIFFITECLLYSLTISVLLWSCTTLWIISLCIDCDTYVSKYILANWFFLTIKWRVVVPSAAVLAAGRQCSLKNLTNTYLVPQRWRSAERSTVLWFKICGTPNGLTYSLSSKGSWIRTRSRTFTFGI